MRQNNQLEQRFWRCLLWVAAALVLSQPASGATAKTAAITASWIGSSSATLPAATDPGWQRFDPERLNVLPNNPNGVWIMLSPSDGQWPEGRWALSIEPTPLYPFEWVPPDGGAVTRLMSQRSDQLPLHGHGRLALLLPPEFPHSSAIILHVPPYPLNSEALSFHVRSLDDYQRLDARWLAIVSICFGIMLGTAAISLVFALYLRDRVFGYYVAYILSYAAVQAYQSGFVFDPIGLVDPNENLLRWGQLLTGLSVVFATLFFSHFADLKRYVPILNRVALAIAAMIGIASALAFVPSDRLHSLLRLTINPLLIVAAPLLLAAALTAWLRGARLAGFLLVGWTPLLVLTSIASLQLFGFVSGGTHVELDCVLAGAFEAVALSIGLADRSLALRHDRDRATRLAETDSLTGLLNRRGWIKRMSEILIASRKKRHAVSLLFIDLDEFKQLNDIRGHAAGDEALTRIASILIEQLRAQDLIARHGGEEFVVGLPQRRAAEAMKTAEHLRAAIETARIPTGYKERSVTASIGVVEHRAGEPIEALLSRADQAMYRAKTGGRNRVEVE